MKNIFFAIVIGIIAFGSVKSYDLVTDRPGFYNNPQIVDAGSVVTEFGVQTQFFNAVNNFEYSIEPMLNTIKYGAGEKVELRLGIGYQYQGNRVEALSNGDDFIQNMAFLGAKVNLLEDENDILSTELSFTLPTFNNGDYIPPVSNISLLYTRKLNETMAISSNLRYSFFHDRFPDLNVFDIHVAFEHSPYDNFGWLLESWTNGTFEKFNATDVNGNPVDMDESHYFTGGNIAVWFRPVEFIQLDAQVALLFDVDDDPNQQPAHTVLNFGASFLLN